TRSIKIRLDDPPYRPEINLEYLAALLFWNFGSDGGFMHRTFQNIGFSGFGEPILEIPHQPVAFAGDLFGSRFEILGMALALNDDGSQLPASFTQLTNLKQIDSGSVMTLAAGEWTGIPNLVPRTVNDVGGSAPNALFAVGASGAILYSKGGPWIVQASPATAPLYGVHAFSETDLWAVGDEGTALHFDGVTWQKVSGAGQYDELRAVWGKSPDDVWIVGGSWSGFFHWDGVALTKAPIGGADLRDVHGSGDALIAVGHYGSVRHFENGGWVVRTGADGSDMNAVHVLSATDAWAVGENGAIWRWDGVLWTVSDSPTKRTLRSISAIAPNDIWAVGDASTLIHWDGTSWEEQAQSGKTTYTALNAVWTDPATGKGVALGTSEVLMGPMLKVPEKQVPANGAKMIGNQLHFEVEPGVPAHFNYITVTIPGLFGDTPVWSITTDGDVTHIELPDFENIEGTPGIGAGTYKLTIFRVYKDDFDIDNYDFSDLDTTRWRSWAIDETLFS
ncbi:MAG: hypothetical protein IV100_25470, partial [Myxococcales bacterium]|nr:hypothetical protein [Myxococcales bacterium]